MIQKDTKHVMQEDTWDVNDPLAIKLIDSCYFLLDTMRSLQLITFNPFYRLDYMEYDSLVYRLRWRYYDHK